MAYSTPMPSFVAEKSVRKQHFFMNLSYIYIGSSVYLSSCHIPAILSSCHICGTLSYLSYIYIGSSVYLSSCHIPAILSSCHICGTLSYSLCFSNQTDQGDEREGFEREGYRWRDRRWRDWRGKAWIDFSLLKAQPKKIVGSQCHLQLLYRII